MIIFDGIKDASHSTMGNMALLDIAGVEPTSLRYYAMFCTTLNYISFCFLWSIPIVNVDILSTYTYKYKSTHLSNPVQSVSIPVRILHRASYPSPSSSYPLPVKAILIYKLILKKSILFQKIMTIFYQLIISSYDIDI